MIRAHRTQADTLGDQVSFSTGLSFPGDEPGARQEFGPEADLNVLMRRYGVTPGGPQPYGEVDYSIGLQDALRISQEAQEAWERLPNDVRSRYKSWEELLAASQAGQLDQAKPSDPVVTPPSDNRAPAPATPA